MDAEKVVYIKTLPPSANERSKVGLHPELLIAWLTLRFNPSDCSLSERGRKSISSKRLSVEEIEVDKFDRSADKAVIELKAILLDIMQRTASRFRRVRG